MAKRRYQSEKVYRAVGLKIRELRERREWILEDMDGEEGFSWQQIQKIESGANITLRTIVRLANIFGVHPAELLSDL